MNHIFKAGDQARCIDDGGFSDLLVLGSTYEIEAINATLCRVRIGNLSYYFRGARFAPVYPKGPIPRDPRTVAKHKLGVPKGTLP